MTEARPDETSEARERMVRTQVERRGVRDARVLAAMRAVPRHRFVPGDASAHAYEDRALPVGWGQTISQPYIVALMSELAAVSPPCRVLEVGTGSGYQAAVLAEMGCLVFSIEIVEPLAARSSAWVRRCWRCCGAWSCTASSVRLSSRGSTASWVR